jgi:hypothetical protein
VAGVGLNASASDKRRSVERRPPAADARVCRNGVWPVVASSGDENHSSGSERWSNRLPVTRVVRSDAEWHTILPELKLGGMARELGQHCELRACRCASVGAASVAGIVICRA